MNTEPSSKKTITYIGFFLILVAAAAAFFIFTKQAPKPKQQATGAGNTPGEKIRIAFPALGTVITGQVGTVLQKTTILKDNGLNAAITPMNTGKEMKLALIGGQVDVILTSETNFVVLLGQGFKSYAIASLGTDGQMGLVVNTDSDIKTVADLKNKKVGTLFGTSVHRPAVEWVTDAGLTPGKDVEIVNFGGAEALRVALASKQVDAIVTWDPYLLDGINQKVHRQLVGTDLDLVVVASKDYADKNPEAITRLRKSLKDAMYYLSQNKTEVSGWYSELSKLNHTLITDASKANANYNASSSGDINITISQGLIDKFVKQEDFLFEDKLIKEKPEISQYIKQ